MLAPIVEGELIQGPALASLRSGVGADKHQVVGATDKEFSMNLTAA